MRDGVCPKCHALTVYHNADLVHGNTIPIKNPPFPTFARVTHYVCVTCGYVESYVQDDRMRDEIITQWDYVGE